jgi:kynurenine formamidase
MATKGIFIMMKSRHLIRALDGCDMRVLDLTTPLCEKTPMIQLPPERGQPWSFSRQVISQYDERGPQVYWNNISMSEHTGTHFDAPNHWLSGRQGVDIAQVPASDLVRPVVVVDICEQVAQNPDYLLSRSDILRWQARHGELPDRGWLVVHSGWESRSETAATFLNDGSWPGISDDCASWLATQTSIIGLGVETVGTPALSWRRKVWFNAIKKCPGITASRGRSAYRTIANCWWIWQSLSSPSVIG